MAQLSRSGMWYLFDYGMVISTAPEPEDWIALEQETGLDLQPAGSPYWFRREDFDAGHFTPAAYWSGVLGHAVEDSRVRVLEELDAAQWAHLNPATLAVLDTLRNEAAQLALLSNMPADMSRRYLRGSGWAHYFAKTYFSGQLGLTKPDPRIFRHVLADLPAAPGDVVFIDDNEQNIAAARALGLQTVHHGPGTDLRQELLDLRK